VLAIARRHRIVAAAECVLAADFSVPSLDRQLAATSLDELVAPLGDRSRLRVEDKAARGVVPLIDPLVV